MHLLRVIAGVACLGLFGYLFYVKAWPMFILPGILAMFLLNEQGPDMESG